MMHQKGMFMINSIQTTSILLIIIIILLIISIITTTNLINILKNKRGVKK